MVVLHALSEALEPVKYYSWQTSVSMKFEPEFTKVLIRKSCFHPWKARNKTSNDPFKKYGIARRMSPWKWHCLPAT